ncbi:MAG: DUF4340 domain-containing protein [Planctomycetota bacterium]
MSDTVKTLIYVAVAIVCGLGAWLLANPAPSDPPFFSDQGEEFFPGFQDASQAAALEVIEFDEETATAEPFKVEVKNGLWSIPSRYGYPADGKDRLAKAASGVIALRKDQVISDSQESHAELGLVDPLDSSQSELTGWGKRITIRNGSDNVLADLIIGKPVKGREGMRYVRVPGKNRAYAVKMDVDLSTKFADWIETDLTKLDGWNIDQLELDNYSIDERTLSITPGDVIELTKNESSQWEMAEAPEGRELDTSKVSTLTSTLDSLSIVDVRRKPEGITGDLTQGPAGQINQIEQSSLQSKGYFFTRDGKLVSNEGELRAWTKAGVRYTLRFGEVVYGSEGEASEESTEETPKGGENRYLFISVDFDDSRFEKPAPPEGLDLEFYEKWKEDSSVADTSAEDLTDEEKQRRTEQRGLADQYDSSLASFEAKKKEGQEKAEELKERFAPWYYVISADSFSKLHLSRDELLKEKAPEEDEGAGDEATEPTDDQEDGEAATSEEGDGQTPPAKSEGEEQKEGDGSQAPKKPEDGKPDNDGKPDGGNGPDNG